MQFLKWYSIVYISLNLITSIYQSGQKKQGVFITLCVLILLIPVLLYLIMS